MHSHLRRCRSNFQGPCNSQVIELNQSYEVGPKLENHRLFHIVRKVIAPKILLEGVVGISRTLLEYHVLSSAVALCGRYVRRNLRLSEYMT